MGMIRAYPSPRFQWLFTRTSRTNFCQLTIIRTDAVFGVGTVNKDVLQSRRGLFGTHVCRAFHFAWRFTGQATRRITTREQGGTRNTTIVATFEGFRVNVVAQHRFRALF